MAETAEIAIADICIILGYFVVVLGVGLYATFKAERGTPTGFFLSGRSTTWIPLAGTIYATNIGAPMFVGLAGGAASTGFAPVMFEWHATYTLIMLGWVFVPIYLSSGCTTMPDYLKRRFGGKRIKIYYALVQLVLTVLTNISGEMYAGSLFINRILGWDLYLSSVFLVGATAIYTIGGGLKAVIYTDTVQMVILIIGTITIAIMALVQVGGYEAMKEQFMTSAANTSYYIQAEHGNLSCAFPNDNSFNIFRGIDSDYPWPGLVFGLTLLATYAWCTNQTMVQRSLSAKNVTHSKAACVVASYLKMLPFISFVIPGMVAKVLYPEEVACASPDKCREVCGNPSGCSNLAYPLLVLRILPAGVRGLMLAAMLAALMSSLTSIFNSLSTVFSMDIWKNIRPKAGDRELVIVGRLWGLLMVATSIAWLPILQYIQGSRLWDYLQSVTAYFTPPWVVVFLLGMFWRRCTEQGAWWGLMASIIAGGIRMGLHVGFPGEPCGSTIVTKPFLLLAKVNFLHFAIILAGVTLCVTVPVSYLTKPRPPSKLHKVTWQTRHDTEDPDLTEDEAEYDERKKPPPPTVVEGEESTGTKLWNCLCGFKSAGAAPEPEEPVRTITDIKEDPFWSKVCNFNAMLVLVATCFMIGFFA